MKMLTSTVFSKSVLGSTLYFNQIYNNIFLALSYVLQIPNYLFAVTFAK